MKLFVINHYAGSPSHGMEYRPFYLGREWVRMGNEVTLVASSFSHVRTKQPNICGWTAEESIEGVRYLWLATPAYRGNGVGRMLNIVTFLLQLFRLVFLFRKRYAPDLVVASSTYPLDIFPAYCLARLSKAKLAFEVHDLWPLSPIELGGYSRWHPFIMALQVAEDFAYRHCDWVVSMLPCAKPYMVSRGLQESKFLHVPNGIAIPSATEKTSGHMPAQHSSVLRVLKKQGRFIVAYAGAHGLANALDSVLDAAALLELDGVTFVLVGEGPEKDRLREECARRKLTDVGFLPGVTRAEIAAVLRFADVLYISLQGNSLFRFGISPNKLFDYMMAGRPLIQAIDAGNDIVGESACGLTIAPENPEALADAVRRLIRAGEAERRHMGQNGRRYVTDKHDYTKLARLFPMVG